MICKGKGISCNTAPHAAGVGIAQEPDLNPRRLCSSPYLIGEDIVDRDAVAPPQLPADAPVPDVLKPPVVDFLEPLRHNLDVTIPHSLQGSTHCGNPYMIMIYCGLYKCTPGLLASNTAVFTEGRVKGPAFKRILGHGASIQNLPKESAFANRTQLLHGFLS